MCTVLQYKIAAYLLLLPFCLVKDIWFTAAKCSIEILKVWWGLFIWICYKYRPSLPKSIHIFLICLGYYPTYRYIWGMKFNWVVSLCKHQKSGIIDNNLRFLLQISHLFYMTWTNLQNILMIFFSFSWPLKEKAIEISIVNQAIHCYCIWILRESQWPDV